MKIVCIGNNKVTEPFYKELSRHADVTIFNYGTNDLQVEQTVLPAGPVLIGKFLKERQTMKPYYLKGLRNKIETIEPDVIIVMDFVRLWFLQALSHRLKNTNCKLILWSETKAVPKSFASRLLFYPLYFTVYILKKHINSVLVYTVQGKDWFEKNFALASRVVAPSVNTTLFNNKATPDISNMLNILCSARLESYKRIDDLIRALSYLSHSDMNKVHVTILGDGSLRKRLEKDVKSRGLENTVTFIRRVPHEKTVDIYNDHDALVLCSYNEAIGRVVPEAMACGLATITSDTVGANAYVKEGVTGWVYRTGDIQELSDILRLCIRNKSEVRTRGLAANEHIRTNFKHADVLKEFVNVVTR